MAPLTPDQEQALDRLRRQQIAEARRIRRVVAGEYRLTVRQLRGRRRVAPVNEARQVCMYLMRTDLCWPRPHTNIPFPAGRIAQLLGGRDHSTVLHGVGVIVRRLQDDTRLTHIISDLRADLWRVDDYHTGGHHGPATHHPYRPDRRLAGQYPPVRPQGQGREGLAGRTGRVHAGTRTPAAAQGAA